MDWYRKFLARAHWDWLECKMLHRWHHGRTKDRVNGRAEKRKAKQLVRKDIEES